MNKIVKPHDSVLIHLSVFLDDESIADSTVAMGKPALIQLGDGSLSPAFDQKLMGLSQGDKTKFRLEAIDAFGVSNPELVQFMDIHSFPIEMELKPDLVVAFEQPNGESLPGIIRGIEGNSVKVDFNHPMADEAATFQIEILTINPSKKSEQHLGQIPVTVKGAE